MTDNDNLLYLIHRIGSGKLYLRYKNEDLVLLSPSSKIKYEAERLYNQIIQDNLYGDWWRKEDILYWLSTVGLWDNSLEKRLKQTEKTIENTKHQLYMNRAVPTRVKSIKKDLQNHKDTLAKFYERKHSLDYLTLEDFANLQKTEFTIIKTLYYKNGKKRVFNNPNINDVDHSYLTGILREVAINTISLESYKKIVRSEHWKSLWNCNKSNIFNKSSLELSDEQRTLINISLMYDRIYEHPECPDENVIGDDDMLDGWMIEQKRKAEQQKKENQANSVSNRHGNAKEVFIVADKEEVAEVMSMNSWESQNIIKQRDAVIKNAGEESVSVMSLPDMKMDYLKQMNEKMKR